MMPFCPLPIKIDNSKLWQSGSSGNRGLLFDKFPNFWEKTGNEYTFEKSSFLKHVTTNLDVSSQLKEALERRIKLVHAMGGVMLSVKNVSRLVTGLGLEHPMENGFLWHRTLGVPYLPGSSIKGLLRSWLRETKGTVDNGKLVEDKNVERMFGGQNAAGEFVFVDMLPQLNPNLVVDVMTPHYGPYYENGDELPGDWHDPVPIPFLAVEKNQYWHLAILPIGSQSRNPEDLGYLATQLYEALENNGAGAKTAVGYGRMKRQPGDVDDWSASEEKRKKEEQERELLETLPPQEKWFLEVAKLTDQEPYITWYQVLTGMIEDDNAPNNTEIAKKIKEEMIKKKKWKTKPTKKNPKKDKEFQRTLHIMKILKETE